MYKWHVSSALGRSRPLTNDLLRVTDGIAASLRQFSISISRAEDEAPRPSRAQRGAEAARDILAGPRGVDARALAAKPPPSQGLKITRVQVDGRPAGTSFRPRGNFPGGDGNRGGGSGLGRGSRGGPRGARGVRGARGRGRGARQGRGGMRRKEEAFDDSIDPLTPEELTWMAGDDGGWPEPYVPTTSADQLLGRGPAVLWSPKGVLESAVYKMQLATDSMHGIHRHADEHAVKMKNGHGTFFESTEAKEVARGHLGSRKEIPELGAEEKEKMANAWVAGHYDAPAPARDGDLLAKVALYTKLNETYLPEDSRKLLAKLAELIPSAAPPPGPISKPL